MRKTVVLIFITIFIGCSSVARDGYTIKADNLTVTGTNDKILLNYKHQQCVMTSEEMSEVNIEFNYSENKARSSLVEVILGFGLELLGLIDVTQFFK